MDRAQVSFTIELTTPACPVKDQMRDQARAAVMRVPGVGGVDVQMSARVREAVGADGTRAPIAWREERHRRRRGQGRRRQDHGGRQPRDRAGRSAAGRVGIIDADIYGPNVPIMLGMKAQLTTDGQKIVPAEKYGLQVISMGFLTGDDAPDHLARADAARRVAAVLPRGAVDRSRLPRGRHAARYRRRRAEPQPDGAGRRRDRRHDAAAGRRSPTAGERSRCTRSSTFRRSASSRT